MSQPETTAVGGCGCLIFFYLAIWIPLAFWTDRSLDFWCSHIKGAPVDINWWWSFLISIFGPCTFVANIVSEIARSCV